MFDVAVQKVTWQQVGHVAEPGRYLFTFGWLKISDDDLAIWRQFPHAAFTLVAELPTSPADDSEEPSDEFHLGAFDLGSSDASTDAHDLDDETSIDHAAAVIAPAD